MLSGKQVRVRMAKNRLIAQYIDPEDQHWQDVGERLLALFRSLQGCTREELEEEIREAFGDNPTQLVHQGLAKLLEDRCEFEVQSDLPPEEIREKLFIACTAYRKQNATQKITTFDRQQIVDGVAQELNLTAEQIDQGMFADLKAEQRLIHFQDCTVDQLLHRYNVALAQAVLLRSTGITILITGETPARFRQLFRAIKFHRLICDISSSGPDSYMLKLDGPMSLFSSTQKYGLQLALFLPSVLQCRHFELTAHVRWGTQRKEKIFILNQTHELKSHLPDYGSYVPKELTMFADSFRKSIEDWDIAEEASIIHLKNSFWTPDYKLTHRESGKEVYLEILGFWRRTDAEKLYDRLRKEAQVPFLLAVSEQFNIDESIDDNDWKGIYRFKRTPLPDEITKRAEEWI